MKMLGRLACHLLTSFRCTNTMADQDIKDTVFLAPAHSVDFSSTSWQTLIAFFTNYLLQLSKLPPSNSSGIEVTRSS